MEVKVKVGNLPVKSLFKFAYYTNGCFVGRSYCLFPNGDGYFYLELVDEPAESLYDFFADVEDSVDLGFKDAIILNFLLSFTTLMILLSAFWKTSYYVFKHVARAGFLIAVASLALSYVIAYYYRRDYVSSLLEEIVIGDKRIKKPLTRKMQCIEALLKAEKE